MQKVWRCKNCGTPLGTLLDGRLHIQSDEGDNYVVNVPITATCSCGTKNELLRFDDLIDPNNERSGGK